MQSSSTQPVYRFGPFRLEPGERQLLLDGRAVALTPKAFEILLVLARQATHLVTKEELLRQVWPDTIVEESTLAKNIFTLRKALGQQPDGADYIETVPKVGYRFAAAVEAAREESGSGAQTPAVVAVKSPIRGRSPWLWTAALLCLGAAATGLLMHHRRAAQASASTKRTMLAVLPFLNYSGDPKEEFFSDGFTEEMITQLGSLHPDRLGVIARTSAMHYKNTNESIAEIGRELNVDYVLEGSIRRENNRVRISAQLVQVQDQTHVWAANYERDARDVLEVQSDVARQISSHIQTMLGATAVKPARTDISPEAYEAYLLGRYHWNKRNTADLKESVALFRRAIALQPDYARAYAGLADAYLLLGPYDAMTSHQAYGAARAAAQKALVLDDELAEGHASLGFIELLYDWDPAAAEQELRRSLSIDANYSTAHHWLAYDLAAMKRFDEAVAEIRIAEQLDPLSANVAADAGQILYLARRYGPAVAEVQKALDLDPNFSTAHWFMGLLDQQEQRPADAVEEFLRSGPNLQGPDHGLQARNAFRSQGLQGFWRVQLQQLDQAAKRHKVPSFSLAEVAAQAGEKKRAIAELERAVASRHPSSVFLAVEPVFDPLRSDERFTAILRRARLPQ